MAQLSTGNNTPAADRSNDGQTSRAPGKTQAPGAPGEKARWATGAKDGVGTAIANTSSVWFTLSHGIITEIYYPSIDTVAIRDLELFVTDRHHWFSAEGQDTHSEVNYVARGVPAYRLVNTCSEGRYRIEKEILADPRRSVVLQDTHFVPLKGRIGDFCLCVMLRPHLGNQGADNTGWIGEFKGVPMLFARREGTTVAMACSAPWKTRSAGFVGVSDGRRDLERHKHMKWTYERAEGGNVGLTGEIDLVACAGRFLIAVAFGHNEAEAGHRARASLLQGFAAAREEYVRAWSQWQDTLLPLAGSRQHEQNLYHISAMVLHTHESKRFPGAVVASLAVPWGSSMGDQDMGYHLVWPRDMSETVGGLLAIREHEKARRVLFYLEVIQEADGHWPQNAYLEGTACWKGIQLDETALVILLVGLAREQQALSSADVTFLWPMVRRAAEYLTRHGPVTPMDRWEEEPGYYASTMAAEIPALLVAAELAENHKETDLAVYLRETADAWNEAIERLIYVRGTELARRAGVDGYYVRFAGPEQMSAERSADGVATLPNHPPGMGKRARAEIVSPDALALVRFGLRSANDPRILNTVKVIDLVCKVETPRGACWHRYTDDGYGEHTDGSPYNGTGTGRAWPLLTGERAHYELAAGRADEADRLLRALEGFASDSGMLPEQVWDTADIPAKDLYCGRPSGSAMPLVWAHAEYVKLRRSLHDRSVFDMPPQAVDRYVKNKITARHVCWRPEQQWRSIPAGKVLRLELTAPTGVRWSMDGWQTGQKNWTRDTGFGLHVVDLPTQSLGAGSTVVFQIEQPDHSSNEFQVSVGRGND